MGWEELATVPPHGAAPHWRIVDACASLFGDGLYSVTLECEGRDEYEYAYALLRVCDRAARGTHEPADWSVHVETCDDPDACAWLESAEHEYAIGKLCVTGVVP